MLEENGAESNAATWVDWTYYYESLPADRFALAVKLESERMARLVLRDKQVASEKEVVANERRYRVDDDVEGAANELLYKTAFTKHPYGWPTIGWMPDILGFTPEDCDASTGRTTRRTTPSSSSSGTCARPTSPRVRDAYAASSPRRSIPAEDSEPEPPQTEAREVADPQADGDARSSSSATTAPRSAMPITSPSPS